MICSNKKTIEDIIVEILAQDSYLEGPDLVIAIKKIRPNTVKQTVYTALGYLLADEIVSKVGGKYFLSRVWINKINKMIPADKQFANDAVFDLEEGDSISYSFPTLLTCDTYWVHIFDLLVDWIPKQKPIIIWMSHEWFIIGRREAELDILKKIRKSNKHAFYSLLGKTPLDQEFRKDYSGERISISTGSSTEFPVNYFLHIFDDIMIEVFIDEKLARKIEKFYTTYTKLTSENKNEFEKLITEKYKVRMKITRNSKKTSILRKKISKDFFIRKEIEL